MSKNMTKNAVVSVDNISFGYEGQALLEGVSFDVVEGDFAAIIGDNGVGKSTMIKLLLGLLRPGQGEVKIFGVNALSRKATFEVGYVPQNSGALASSFPATVGEILASSLMGRHSRKETADLVNKALESVGMLEYKDRLISKLSGGQQQRVMLSRVLINSPKLLILDEPTVGIDGDSVDRLMEILHRQNIDHKMTILMVTHDLARVAPYVNRVLCISDHSMAETACPEATIVHAHSHEHKSGERRHVHCAACESEHDSEHCASCNPKHDHTHCEVCIHDHSHDHSHDHAHECECSCSCEEGGSHNA